MRKLENQCLQEQAVCTPVHKAPAKPALVCSTFCCHARAIPHGVKPGAANTTVNYPEFQVVITGSISHNILLIKKANPE